MYEGERGDSVMVLGYNYWVEDRLKDEDYPKLDLQQPHLLNCPAALLLAVTR